jgi:hypothetical protein
MGKIKGVEFNDAYEYFLKNAGNTGMEKVKAALAPAVRESLFSKGSILAVEWYDYAAYVNFVFTAVKILGNNQPDFLYNMAVYQAQKLYNGPWKLFFKILSPSFVIKKAAQFWRLSYDSGDVTILICTKDHVSFKVTNFPDIPKDHELEQIPFFEELMRVSNCREPHATHPKCIARGDDCCLFHLDWKNG